MRISHVIYPKNHRIDCPICSCNSFCDIHFMNLPTLITDICILVCRACGQPSTWKQFDYENNHDYYLRLIDPILPDAPLAPSEKGC